MGPCACVLSHTNVCRAGLDGCMKVLRGYKTRKPQGGREEVGSGCVCGVRVGHCPPPGMCHAELRGKVTRKDQRWAGTWFLPPAQPEIPPWLVHRGAPRSVVRYRRAPLEGARDSPFPWGGARGRARSLGSAMGDVAPSGGSEWDGTGPLLLLSAPPGWSSGAWLAGWSREACPHPVRPLPRPRCPGHASPHSPAPGLAPTRHPGASTSGRGLAVPPRSARWSPRPWPWVVGPSWWAAHWGSRSTSHTADSADMHGAREPSCGPPATHAGTCTRLTTWVCAPPDALLLPSGDPAQGPG